MRPITLLMRKKIIWGVLVLQLLWSVPSYSAGDKIIDSGKEPVFQMSLEELLDLEITSISKKPQKWFKSPAAVFVITQEDIRRSGATSIPEVLRLAPGVHVARIDGNKWAISIRGFNGRFANKLLVLMDGRSVYTPLFAGVYWDVQNTLLEDIDRIEVIRGPGGTLWGANAVNGVINIITKNSKDTQGGLVTLGGGNEERVFGGARYGDKIGDNAYFRIYAKYFNRDDQADESGEDALDDWEVSRGGFRMDWELSTTNAITIQGDYYDGDAGRRRSNPVRPDRTYISGGNLLGRWNHIFSDTSDMSLQIYYDRTERYNASIDENRDTLDVDFQSKFAPFLRHEIIWGFEYRYTEDDTDDPGPLSFTPKSRDDELFSAFIQDEIALITKRLYLTIGSKFEHNDYSGFEYQPSVRLSWTPNRQHTLWAAISRAVRTPSRIDHDQKVEIMIPGVGPFTVVEGNPDYDSEELVAYELGYRINPTDRLYIDFATFYNDYDNLQTTEVDNMGSATFENNMEADTYGIEVATHWDVTDFWRVAAGYSFLKTQFDLDESSNAFATKNAMEKADPRHKASILSHVILPHNFEFDTALYYVDSVPISDIPSYFRLDARLGWRPTKALDMSIVLQNAFDDQHPEFPEGTIENSEIQRSVFGKITWRF